MSPIKSALNFIYQLTGRKGHINPYFLCTLLGISVVENYPLEKDGYLICSEGVKLIFVSNTITNVHRKQFIIAHEIGHFMLHREQMYCCSEISIESQQRVNSLSQEQQANEFASELLLPTDVLTMQLPSEHLSFAFISNIANKYNVSVTMAAMKAVKHSRTKEEILLCYENNTIKWYSTGNTEIRYSQIPPRCPMELDSNSNYSNLSVYWDDLFISNVSQEVFHPFGNQYLVLLAGQEWNILYDH